MSNVRIRIHTQFMACPGQEAELRNLLIQLMKSRCQQAGCSSCEVLEHRVNSSNFILIEEWEAEARMKSDLNGQTLKGLFEQGAELIAEPPQIEWYDVTTP